MGSNSNAVALQKRLHKNGYEFIRQHGSHKIYKHPVTGREVVVNLKLNKMVMKRLEKEI